MWRLSGHTASLVLSERRSCEKEGPDPCNDLEEQERRKTAPGRQQATGLDGKDPLSYRVVSGLAVGVPLWELFKKEGTSDDILFLFFGSPFC